MTVSETEIRGICFEDGGRGYNPGNIGGLWKLEKTRKQIIHQSCQRGSALSTARERDLRLLPSKTVGE